MIKYNRIFISLLFISLTLTASQLTAQSIEEIEKLYIGKWLNVEDKADTLTIEKLKTGYLVVYQSDKKLSYISNGILFVNYIYSSGFSGNYPFLIDNENQLVWRNETNLMKFKKVK